MQGGTVPSLVLKDDLQSCVPIWAPQSHMDHAMLPAVQPRTPKGVKAQCVQEDAGELHPPGWSVGQAEPDSPQRGTDRGMRQQSQGARWEFCLNIRTYFFHTEGNQALEKFVETEDIHSSIGHGFFQASPSRGSFGDSVTMATAVE